MMRLATLILAALVVSGATPASARVETPAKVRYETQEGKSRWVDMSVTFMTGQELNTATNSFRYSSFANYAVIFFAQDQAAVIKLTGLMIGCGNEFSAACLPSLGNSKGTDQGGREWEICTGSFC